MDQEDKIYKKVNEFNKNNKEIGDDVTSNAVTVAVIIPYYNGSQFIERAIRSVYEQTVQPDELIVVNDGSSDSESKLLTDLGKSYGFTIINKENGGQGSSRNSGVYASKSEYICFLDQDDYYLPDHIRILVNSIPKYDIRFGFVYGDLYEADEDGNIIRMGMIKEHSSHPKRNIAKMLGTDMFILPSASIISKKCFIFIGGFDEQFTGYEDDDLFLRIFRAGFTNFFIDECVTVWCIHASSTSYSVKMSRSRLRYLKKLRKLYPDRPKLNNLYFRDLLLPRFGPMIINDAIKAKFYISSDLPEIISITDEFNKIVQRDKFVSKKYKVKLSVFTYLVKYANTHIFKTIIYLTKFRGIVAFAASQESEAGASSPQ